jgi:hypothetical protein
LGLGGRRERTLQDNPILQARILTVEGSSSTLGVDYTFGEVRPSLGRRCGPRISTLKDDIIITPGPSPLGSSPRIRLEQAARLVTPRPRPAIPRRHQPGLRPRQINSGVGPANGRPGQAPADQVFFSSQLYPAVPARRDGQYGQKWAGSNGGGRRAGAAITSSAKLTSRPGAAREPSLTA